MLDKQTSEILQALYGATIDPQQWTRALELVGAAVGATAGALEFVAHSKGNWQALAGFGYNQTLVIEDPKYGDWPEHDPWINCVEAEPMSNLIVGTKHVPAKQYRNSVFHNDYARALDADWRDLLAVIPRFNGDLRGIFALYRSASADDFGGLEIARMDSLKPHIINALTIASRFENLAALNQAAQQLLDGKSEALLVLDQAGSVLFCNRKAEKMFTGQRPTLSLRRGRLRLEDSAADAKFQRLLSAHLSAADGLSTSADITTSSMVWTDPQIMRPYSLCLTPNLPALSPDQFTSSRQQPAVAISISDFRPQAHRISERMQDAFDLTSAESAVLELLIDGLRPDEICTTRGVSMNTVRVQLKSLFRKTGTSSQAELINRSLLGFA